MKNKEKYSDDIIKMFSERMASCNFRKSYVEELKDINCYKFDCNKCNKIFKKWLEEEYIEQVVDWTKVPMNAEVLVRDDKYASWCPRTFVFYNEGKDYPFVCIAENGQFVTGWRYAKLIEE